MMVKENRMVYLVAALAATGGLLFGFDTGVISGALLFIEKSWTLSTVAREFIVSSVLIGAVLGALVSGKLVDYMGRKNIILMTALLFIVGSLGSALAMNAKWLMMSRIVVGLAIGMASFAVPLYISEISPPKVRGALVSLNQLMITIGIVLSYFVDDLCAFLPHNWRVMFLLGAVPGIILAVGMLFVPDSPRWLLMKKMEEKARAALKMIGNEDIEKEISEMKKADEEHGHVSFKDLFTPWLLPVMTIGIVMMFIQQATGINTVIYYAPTIFQMAGFQSEVAAITATMVVGIVNVLMTIVSIRLIDKWGRKPLLSIGLIGIVVTLVLLGFSFLLQSVLGDAMKWIAIACVIIYIASFAVSLGPICWLIISEIYPLRIRGLAMSIATLSNWLFNFAVASTFLSLVNGVGAYGAFWFYAFVGVLGWIFCRYYVPETKGHTLEQIETHFRQGKSPAELR